MCTLGVQSFGSVETPGNEAGGRPKVEIQHDPTTKNSGFVHRNGRKVGIFKHQMGGIFNRQLDSMEIEAANQGFDQEKDPGILPAKSVIWPPNHGDQWGV
jgi:hypothetical protein